jgi:hypothetical protein
MAASMTSYLQKKLLDHTLGLAAFTMPTTVYASLHTGSPGESGATTFEVSTTSSGYGRVAITSKMNATDATSGVSSNNAAIAFGPATTDWGTITYVAISDAATGGNMLMYGALTVVQTTPIGESVQFSASQFAATFA